ncbi:MAG TPA: tail fiber protein [Aliidongia sp.]|nr:tail fiber protein [Aliidongia sp.]
MTEPFLAQITLMGFNFPPNGWALCQGQILPIAQNTALFSLLGVNFGGNGTTNFALPDLRGRIPIGQGQGPGLSPYVVGEDGGVESVTLINATIPTHSHALPAIAGSATTNVPDNNLTARALVSGRGSVPVNSYTQPGALTPLSPAQLGAAPGGSGPHTNLQPFLTLNWCIALQGVFPARS